MGKRVQNISTIADLDNRFRVMDEFDEYCQIISLPGPPVEILAGPDKSPDMAKIANDGFAELVAKYPARFPSFVACLPMNNPDAALKEMDRASINSEQLECRCIPTPQTSLWICLNFVRCSNSPQRRIRQSGYTPIDMLTSPIT